MEPTFLKLNPWETKAW